MNDETVALGGAAEMKMFSLGVTRVDRIWNELEMKAVRAGNIFAEGF